MSGARRARTGQARCTLQPQRHTWPRLSTARSDRAWQLALVGWGATMIQTPGRPASRAGDDACHRRLRRRGHGGAARPRPWRRQALEQAIRTCLAQPASLATRYRAIELLARVRYEDPCRALGQAHCRPSHGPVRWPAAGLATRLAVHPADRSDHAPRGLGFGSGLLYGGTQDQAVSHWAWYG